ncbi:hypothetical protein pEaSNUABM38_00120 [Erwinia phage pEa_SNUABM_38]|nr:hypothetical protein pEaSNUABM38_00120 [Erwinia phage pEa_SNUABM_38]
MLKYLSWALLELFMFVLVGAGMVLSILPALCFMIGFAGQERAEFERVKLRSELGIRWRERNRAAAQRECGKRPN